MNILLGATRSSPGPLTSESLGLEWRCHRRLNVAAAAADDDDDDGEGMPRTCLLSLYSLLSSASAASLDLNFSHSSIYYLAGLLKVFFFFFFRTIRSSQMT